MPTNNPTATAELVLIEGGRPCSRLSCGTPQWTRLTAEVQRLIDRGYATVISRAHVPVNPDG